jgi:hypothetical protein
MGRVTAIGLIQPLTWRKPSGGCWPVPSSSGTFGVNGVGVKRGFMALRRGGRRHHRKATFRTARGAVDSRVTRTRYWSDPSVTRLGGPVSGPPGRFAQAPVLSPLRPASQVCRNVLPGPQPRSATGPGKILVRRLQDRPDSRVVRGDTVHQLHPSSIRRQPIHQSTPRAGRVQRPMVTSAVQATAGARSGEEGASPSRSGHRARVSPR